MQTAVTEPACADLDDAGRRRLWIVQLVLERCSAQHPADALEFAFRLDSFITRGTCAKPARVEEARPERPPVQKPAAAEPAPAALPAESPLPAQERGRIPLLRSELREQFAALAATGVDNRALAERFRLSVRQAHAIRLSLARQRPEVRPPMRPTAGAARPALSREEELKLQERFLREKPSAPCTIDDVVRFLRQRGDSVISRDGRYLVDERLLLSADQLVARANRRRREVGAPEFNLDVHRAGHTGAVSLADGAGAAEAG